MKKKKKIGLIHHYSMSSSSNESSINYIEDAILELNFERISRIIEKHENERWLFPFLIELSIENTSIKSLEYLLQKGCRFDGIIFFFFQTHQTKGKLIIE